LLLLVAVLKTSEVGNFTLEALVIGTLKHGKVLQVVVVEVVDVAQPGFFVEPFVFASFKRFFSNYFLNRLSLKKKLL
jgi:hypothetical protein